MQYGQSTVRTAESEQHDRRKSGLFRDVTCKNESDGLREVTPMACCQGQAGTRFEQGVSGVFEFLYQHTGILGQ